MNLNLSPSHWFLLSLSHYTGKEPFSEGPYTLKSSCFLDIDDLHLSRLYNGKVTIFQLYYGLIQNLNVACGLIRFCSQPWISTLAPILGLSGIWISTFLLPKRLSGPKLAQ